MSKKNGLPDNFDWPALINGQDQIKTKGPNYKLGSVFTINRPMVKVPLDMLRRLEAIAKENGLEPWEVIQELLEYRFKESA